MIINNILLLAESKYKMRGSLDFIRKPFFEKNKIIF